MKLITDEFETLFKDYPLNSQDKESDFLIIAKLFNDSVTWYLVEYNSIEKIAFGYATETATDEGAFLPLIELEANGLKWDKAYIPRRLSECLK